MGGVAERIKWVGGVSNEAVKKPESAGECRDRSQWETKRKHMSQRDE